MVESEEELKSCLMRVKKESERTDLRLNSLKTKIIASTPITPWQIEGQKVEVVTEFLLGAKITAQGWLQPQNQMIVSQQESDNKPSQCVEKQRHYSANRGPYSQGYGLLSGHVELWELDHKEGRMPKNWCLQNMALEKTSESPLDSKEIKPVNLNGDQL